jgi:hypothetical protein
MGHDAYDTQQSLYYVNVYIIYYLIVSMYLKIARESNTNYKNWFLSLEINRKLKFVPEIKASTFELYPSNFFKLMFLC